MNREPCGSVSKRIFTRNRAEAYLRQYLTCDHIFAFKVLSFLVGNENLQVIEIALTCGELANGREVLGGGKMEDGTHSNNTKVEQEALQYLDNRASSCLPLC